MKPFFSFRDEEESKTEEMGDDSLFMFERKDKMRDLPFLYLKSFLREVLRSESFFMTLETAISKSSWLTCTRLSRRAYIPASVQTAFWGVFFLMV